MTGEPAGAFVTSPAGGPALGPAAAAEALLTERPANLWRDTLANILEDAGADLTRVTMSHCDQLVEPDWHARIAERGVMLCFDTFGAEFTYDSDGSREPTDTERIACLGRLLDAGRASQLLLSHDICSRLQLDRYGGPGYDHVPRTIVPRLRAEGVSVADVEQMLVANPRRLLAMPA